MYRSSLPTYLFILTDVGIHAYGAPSFSPLAGAPTQRMGTLTPHCTDLGRASQGRCARGVWPFYVPGAWLRSRGLVRPGSLAGSWPSWAKACQNRVPPVTPGSDAGQSVGARIGGVNDGLSRRRPPVSPRCAPTRFQPGVRCGGTVGSTASLSVCHPAPPDCQPVPSLP